MIPEKPQTILTPFCYAGDTRNIPVTTPTGTNQFSYEAGFPPLTSTPLQSGGVPPERQDFNAAFKLLSEFVYYLQSGNKFVWSNLLDYEIGSTVLGSDNALYYCIQANGATSPNTVQDPTTSSGYWNLLITEDGKFNAENLSVTLGAFALLNNIAITDSKITGNLPASRVSGLASVATSGSYNDLSNKPTIPTNTAPLPVSGTGTALGVWRSVATLGSGDYVLPSGGTWAYLIITPTREGTLPIAIGRSYIFSGIASGGTQVTSSNPDAFSTLGFAWRIL